MQIEKTKRLLCALLTLYLLLTLSLPAYADVSFTLSYLENLPLYVDGGEAKTVKTLHYGYGNNRYVSLRDMAAALNGTAKSFGLNISGDQVTITTNTPYTPQGGENEPFPEVFSRTGAPYVYTAGDLFYNSIELDGSAVWYQSFMGQNTAERRDCFLSLTDLAMQLDLDVEVSSRGILLNTAGNYRIDLETLKEDGFYYEVHSALVGDATTGEIFSAWEPELSVPIASTTKLMSFAVVMDAVTDGEISLADKVKITEAAEQLSHTADGMINLQTGTEVTLTELLCGMLLRSSNECALALAIHTAGSEEALVERMNRKARVLNLSDGAVFYNCHGLPVYTDNLAATKIQNRMSAADMFRLVAYMLRAYPDLTRITSMKSVYLESLDITVSNSNTLLYNLPNTVGLKTGTTNMSGSCLVAAAQAEDAEGNTHILVSVEFGAEDSGTRNTFSEELLRYGMQCLREGSASIRPAVPPADAETLIRTVLESF